MRLEILLITLLLFASISPEKRASAEVMTLQQATQQVLV